MTLQAMVKHIQLWLIDKLIPFARNPRTHSEAQIAQIAASIAEFGFNNPILVDTKAGIIAGHGRLLAARKLGLSEVPVIVLDHLSGPPNGLDDVSKMPALIEVLLERGYAERDVKKILGENYLRVIREVTGK